MSYHPDVAAPGAADTIDAFATMAVECGVRRLVLLSGRGEAEAQRAEQAVQDSGADWTIVRSSWFDQNFSEGLFLPAVLGGEVALPVGDMVEPFVDIDDIADIAVAALTRNGHQGQVYGRNAHLSDGVQRALDREPRDFTDYARDAAAAGAWAAAPAALAG